MKRESWWSVVHDVRELGLQLVNRWSGALDLVTLVSAWIKREFVTDDVEEGC